MLDGIRSEWWAPSDQNAWTASLGIRTGVTSLTNDAAFAHADAPLFLFHLLEFADVEVDLDFEAINQRWASPDYIDSWSQMVVKHTADTVDILNDAPQSGLYRLGPDGGMEYVRFDSNWQAMETEDDAFSGSAVRGTIAIRAPISAS